MYLSGLSWPSFASVCWLSLVDYAYWSTVDGKARNCFRSPLLRVIFGDHTAMVELQSMRQTSIHGCLPTHIRFRPSAQSRQSRRICRTLCGPAAALAFVGVGLVDAVECGLAWPHQAWTLAHGLPIRRSVVLAKHVKGFCGAPSSCCIVVDRPAPSGSRHIAAFLELGDVVNLGSADLVPRIDVLRCRFNHNLLDEN
ncbi:hypothetical protein BR93DRAFT_391143 [Coniochaeta sp. PMI_546]|nr:hypothetical protein BR93DRAFT_391143 [Coniochaeta sp. PMI_546]